MPLKEKEYYMSGETVIYINKMNLVPLRRFTTTEINLFFEEQDN